MLNKFIKQPSNHAPITVEARKYDDSVHRRWECFLLEESGEMYTLYGEFAAAVEHPLLGVLRRGTMSYEFYWKNRWFNVFRFHEPDGTFKHFYCNLNLPPRFDQGVLSYIDLDIDVLVAPDLTYQILDLDEFAENSIKFAYPSTVIEQTKRSLDELLALIEQRAFPFDGQFQPLTINDEQ